MLGFELESVGLAQLAAELFERFIGNLDHSRAGLAHEMVVSVVGEVVDGRSVPEVYVFDDAEVLQVVQKAIHRRLVDVGERGLDRRGELFGSWMVSVFEQRVQDGPPRVRDPSPVGPQLCQDLIDPLGNVHRRSPPIDP